MAGTTKPLPACPWAAFRSAHCSMEYQLPSSPRPLFCFVAVFIYIPQSASLSCTPAFVGAGPGRSSAVAGTLPTLYPSRLPNCISTIRVLKHREPLLRGVFVFQERDKLQRTMALELSLPSRSACFLLDLRSRPIEAPTRRWSVNGAFFMECVWCHAFAVS